ncbi:hypothetical protein QF117_01695 [Vibrio sp. YMD68]|uniref:hypothetical protein n=1 Tax=Vibrio sp. YMD68 TaxID=3042300 RepID=UPI00249A9EF2|nr:hypothetical protein [Vibrio sp. YMD68]WGV98705.1 hypothetical protein QF117_01695 [Vibrio sp. YMD68]
MKKRILPIPLILLIPIFLLVVVIVAGVYRFSLSDEEIMQKFPNHEVVNNAIVSQLFGINSSNPLTIQVPETHAFAFVNYLNEGSKKAIGEYDDGKERGSIFIDIQRLKSIEVEDEKVFVAPLAVSNQGSGVFYYLALFRYDAQRDRMILGDYQLLGDRVDIQELAIYPLAYEKKQTHEKERTHEESAATNDKDRVEDVSVLFLTRSINQAMSSPASVEEVQRFQITNDYRLVRVLVDATATPAGAS